MLIGYMPNLMQPEDTTFDDVWDGALDPFAHDPAAAFILSQLLFRFKQSINSGPEACLWVINALDQGIERLCPFTDAHTAAYKLYLLAVEGNLRPEHDPTVIASAVGQRND